MKRLLIAFSTLFVLVAVPALADQAAALGPTLDDGISPGEVTATPEMWFYEQYRRDYLNPKMAVRKKAEFRAIQRQRRIAAMKWFGLSNQRPRTGSDPLHGDWSPVWTSNNGVYPFRWNAVGRPWITIRPGGTAVWSY